MVTILRTRIGLAAFACFLASIPLANWMILHVGTVCVPQGPCLVPVAPGLLAPSGVLTVGAALVLRRPGITPQAQVATGVPTLPESTLTATPTPTAFSGDLRTLLLPPPKTSHPFAHPLTTDGTLTRLTKDGYVWNSLAYSPDGAWLLSERTFGTDMIIQQKLGHGGSDDLILWPTAGGAPVNLTEKWDLEPNAARWSPDGKFVYFTAEKGGTVHLFRVAVR